MKRLTCHGGVHVQADDKKKDMMGGCASGEVPVCKHKLHVRMEEKGR